ncbi:MAG: pilin [Candidatus Paceibacterota bacterium]
MKVVFKKIFTLGAIIAITGVLFATVAFAADFKFQTKWPKSPMGTDIMAGNNPTMAVAIQYLYEWGVGLGGMAVFIALIIAGFEYITSIGNPSKMQDAFNRIRDAVVGLIVLLSSYAVLTMIGINLKSMKIDMPDFKFDSPVSTCTSDEGNPAPQCCEIKGCVPASWTCASGKCARANGGTGSGAAGRDCSAATDCCKKTGCDESFYTCFGYGAIEHCVASDWTCTGGKCTRANGSTGPGASGKSCASSPDCCISEGSCKPNNEKADCIHVVITFEPDGTAPVTLTTFDEQQRIGSDIKIKEMALFYNDKTGATKPCYDPTSTNPAARDVKNRVCNCGLQLFTKSSTSGGGLLEAVGWTNPCENSEVQFVGDNTSLKSYVKTKDVRCLMLSKSPTVY